MNQGETTCFNSVIFLFQFACYLIHKNKQTPPIRYCLINIYYECLVDNCLLRDDLGSLPRYCIFNVSLIRVRPQSVWLCFKLNAWFWWNLCFLSWIWANVHVKQRKNKNVNLHLKLLVSRKIDWERKAWTKKPVRVCDVSLFSPIS